MNQSVEKTHKLIRLNNPVRRGSMPQISAPVDNSLKTHQKEAPIVITPSMMAKNDPRYLFLIEFTAGALGGVVSRTVTAPIDRLRTIFQVESCEANKRHLNPANVFRNMLIEGNWQSLWRGNLVNILKTAPESAIRFAAYEKLKFFCNRNRVVKVNPVEEKLLCGSAAGFVATLTLYPLKTVKTMMNLGKSGEYKSIADCISQVYEKHGVKGFYRGLICNSIAIIPSTGIDLATYETTKQFYSQFMEKDEPNNTEKVLIGMGSSTFGNFFVYPLLFARTRLQSNRSASETTMNLLTKIWARDGVRGIYRGFFIHMLKIAPASGISYITFESFLKMYEIDSLK